MTNNIPHFSQRCIVFFSRRIFSKGKPLPLPTTPKVDPFEDKQQPRKVRNHIRRRHGEPPEFKPLPINAIAVSIPYEDLYLRPAAVEEYKQMTAQRIGMQQLLHAAAESVIGAPHVNRFPRDMNLDRRRKAQHNLAPTVNSLRNGASSPAVAPE
jgi:hypothetical protein